MKKLLAHGCGALLLIGCSAEPTPSFFTNALRSELYTQDGNDSRYDFLMIVDNSDSMAPIRRLMTDNMNTFVTNLTSRKAIDYQIAIATTDLWEDPGALAKADAGYGEFSIVKSAVSADPVGDFKLLIDSIEDTGTSFWEQGLENAYQALMLHGSSFSRAGVPLVLLFITDEDDFSCRDNCLLNSGEMSSDIDYFPLDRYIEYFSQYKRQQASQTYMFPITGLSLEDCTLDSLGTRYIEVARRLGGISRSFSICSDKLADSYTSVAQLIADRGLVFPLMSRSNGTGIGVWLDGQLVPPHPENYIYDTGRNAIVFTDLVPRKGSRIEISYSQNGGS